MRGSKATLPLQYPSAYLSRCAKDSTAASVGIVLQRRPSGISAVADLTNDRAFGEEPTSKDQKQRRYERLGCHKRLSTVVTFTTPLASNSEADVRPPNSHDNVFADRPPACLCSKRRCRLRFRGITKSHCVSIAGPSQCFVLIKRSDSPCPYRLRSAREGPGVPIRPGGRRPALASGAASSDPPSPAGWGDPCPTTEPILFEVRIHFADFPCLHCSIDFHLGDDAVMSAAGRGGTRSSGFSRARAAGHRGVAVLFQPLDPTSGEPFRVGGC
ncbi:hypothetical protein FNV43_RR21508 [Rhamnella rubrinervis]|uniref:Uncharacterized protein n=1 Tax=Rhamnella rubrinervis TaxID=2594499 RepID=A0A8K0GUF7_9ROSA|nr:hypothetical protein FNV43_RR21508 [Rhamnella rubrinervis]